MTLSIPTYHSNQNGSAIPGVGTIIPPQSTDLQSIINQHDDPEQNFTARAYELISNQEKNHPLKIAKYRSNRSSKYSATISTIGIAVLSL